MYTLVYWSSHKITPSVSLGMRLDEVRARRFNAVIAKEDGAVEVHRVKIVYQGLRIDGK